MKKVLWLMALLLTSMTISAEDLWVRGLNGNWDNTDANKLTLVEGTTDQYILADFTITNTCKFVIANSDYSTKYAGWDEYGNEINADKLSLKLGNNNQGNDVACNVTGTFDIKFNLSNTTVTFERKGDAPEPVVTYGIHGQFTDNNWSTTNMTESTDGNWTCTLTPTNATGAFGIKMMLDGKQPNTGGWLRCSAATELSESNATINVAASGTTNPTYSLTAGKAYTFTFNATTGDLTITWATTPDPDPVVSYGVHGQFTNSDWSTTDMTKDADGNWTCTITPTIAGGSFGIRRYVNGTVPETENWLRCAEETELSESNATINVSLTGSKNPTYALTTGKAYTFTFDPTDGNLTITWSSEPTPDPVITYGVHGQFTGDSWSTTNMTEDTDGNWTCTITPTIAGGSFGIKKMLDGEQPSSGGWFRCSEATELSESNATINVAASGTTNPTFSLTTGKAYTFTFDPTDGNLTITWSSEPTPDPVVSYGVHGQFTNSDWSTTDMTKDADGNWTCTITPTIAGGSFGIRRYVNGTVPETDNWLRCAEETELSESNATINVSLTGSKNPTYALTTGKAYTFTFNPTDGNLTITWATTPDPEPVVTPETLYLRGHINATGWTPSNAVAMTKEGNVFTVTSDIVDAGEGYGYFSFSVANGTAEDDTASDWDTNVNSADRYGAVEGAGEVVLGTDIQVEKFAVGVNASSCASWKIAAGTGYTFTVTFTAEGATLKVTQGTTPDPEPEYAPETLYIRGNINATGWTPSNAVAMTKDGNTFTVTSSVVDVNEGYGYISFSVANGTAEDDAASDWDTNVNSADRFGPAVADTEAAFDTEMPVTTYAAGVNASACTSWKVRTGTNMTFIVTFTADGATMKITDFVGVEDITLGAADDVQYYNLQGARVENPAAGIYIEVRGTTARKVAIK